ncbi:MAG TPA: hypothetical protein VG820_04455, partial [Fimbriimonadaceae bacterium]|nr:hypothetical protein [Fimbriimonadaceae bacterium]
SMTYETMKGKSFEDYRAEYKKDEEGGGQIAIQRALFYDGLYDQLAKMTTVWVDKDKKHLTFADPKAQLAGSNDPNDPMAGLQEMMKKQEAKLERMGPKKAE